MDACIDNGWNEDGWWDDNLTCDAPAVVPIEPRTFRREPAPRKRFESNTPADHIIKIPSRMVGKLIGRGGETIRRLQQDSNAKILVRDQNGNKTEVALFGRPEDVDLAERMISEELGMDNRRASAPRNDKNKAPMPEKNDEWLRPWEDGDEVTYPMIRVTYHEHPDVAALTEHQVNKWRLDNNNISVNNLGKEDIAIPNPIFTFEQCFEDYPEILDEIHKQGFEKPSPIQLQAWPIIMRGSDMIGIAQTGTGKTLAYLLPALIHTDLQPIPRNKRSGPNVLVLAPTRELALQIEKEVKKYNYKGIKCVTVCGGKSRRDQIDMIADGTEIVIATPGRLNDLIDAGFLNIKALTYLVLDEADRMLDMGFEPQIRRALLGIRPDIQTVLTSATWPSDVRRLAESFLHDPIQVVVGSLDLHAVQTVDQQIHIVEEDDKYALISEFLLATEPNDKTIVFCSKKITATWLTSELACNYSRQLRLTSIHGGLDQDARETAIELIQTGDVSVLVATDLASRGLDIDNVTHVINYDFPTSIEEYVHRIGRTGRAGKKGISITYITKKDWSKAKELIEILERAGQEVPHELISMSERFGKMMEKREAYGRPSRGRRW